VGAWAIGLGLLAVAAGQARAFFPPVFVPPSPPTT
jgi:hypothetical protein